MNTRDEDGIPIKPDLSSINKEELIKRLILAESLVTLYEAKLDKLEELQRIRELRQRPTALLKAVS